MPTTDRAALVAGLRALADDIEGSDVPLPTHSPSADWLIFTSGGSYTKKVEDQKAASAQIIKGLGGKWDKGKTQGGDLFDFIKEYGGGVRARIIVDRDEVCERVVVRTETIVTPATEATILPAKPESVEEREIVEWRCAPILAEDAIA